MLHPAVLDDVEQVRAGVRLAGQGCLRVEVVRLVALLVGVGQVGAERQVVAQVVVHVQLGDAVVPGLEAANRTRRYRVPSLSTRAVVPAAPLRPSRWSARVVQRFPSAEASTT